MYDSYNRAEVTSPGGLLKALEDDVRDEGVGAVPTTLQAEMMPSRKKRVLSLSKKSWLVDKMSHRTNLPCFTINLILAKCSTHPVS